MKYAITKDKTIKMPRATHKAWVEALRSGKYKQGAEYLRRRNHYCCLGVLQCIVLGVDRRYPHQGLPDQSALSANNVFFDIGTSFTVSGGSDITSFNDGTVNIRQHSFEEIADIIDQLVEFTD